MDAAIATVAASLRSTERFGLILARHRQRTSLRRRQLDAADRKGRRRRVSRRLSSQQADRVIREHGTEENRLVFFYVEGKLGHCNVNPFLFTTAAPPPHWGGLTLFSDIVTQFLPWHTHNHMRNFIYKGGCRCNPWLAKCNPKVLKCNPKPKPLLIWWKHQNYPTTCCIKEDQLKHYITVYKTMNNAKITQFVCQYSMVDGYWIANVQCQLQV